MMMIMMMTMMIDNDDDDDNDDDGDDDDDDDDDDIESDDDNESSQCEMNVKGNRKNWVRVVVLMTTIYKEKNNVWLLIIEKRDDEILVQMKTMY